MMASSSGAAVGGWSAMLYWRFRRRALQSRDRRIGVLEKSLQHAFAAARTADAASPLNGIERALGKTGNGSLVSVGRDWWSSYVDAVVAPAHRFEEHEKILLAVTAELRASVLSAAEWRELYRLCLVSGLYVVGMLLREKAVSQARRSADANSADIGTLRLGFAAVLESGTAAEAKSLLRRLETSGEDPARCKHGLWLTEVLLEGSRELFPDAAGPVGKTTLDAIRGRRIALVGPVPVQQENGPEIDSFDLVAKFNYRGGPSGCDPATQGRRVDLSYYNIQQAKYIARKMDPGFLSAVPFPIFIKEKGQRLLRSATDAGRVLINLQWLLIDSEFNAGPNAVFDLLRFGPAQIKVFNLDLMLTAGRFEGYARPGDAEVNYSLSFAKTHDPVMQFQFLQKLRCQGLIEGDERFEQVLSLSVDEYVRQLQAGHGEIAREALRGTGIPS